MTNPIGTPEDRELIEPSAYLKHWTDDDGNYRCRVDLTEICEPWLDALNPTITPLYAATALQSRIEEVAMLREAGTALAEAVKMSKSALVRALTKRELSLLMDDLHRWNVAALVTPTQPGDH